MFYCSNTTYTHKKAFGLVELMVSMSIMALMATVMVARQSSFNGAVLLRNQAYEIAYTIRQAQLLAVSGNDTTVRTYGVFVNKTSNEQNKYVLFKDIDEDGRYTEGEEIGLPGRLDDRFMVRDIINGATDTSFAGGHITFTRPDFDAHFCGGGAGPCTLNGPFYIDIARVGTEDTDKGTGQVRRVQVSSTGQIGVVTYGN
jgi:prepilin-type N-terminal cleavage/methylation domain-containing protein